MLNDGSAVVRVLVLDDEPEYAQPNVDALRRRKYDVVQTMTVDETLEILRREGQSFRVLVLDMLMPGSGGPPTARSSPTRSKRGCACIARSAAR